MAITASIAASRSSGILPLLVFFDATGTLSDETTQEFHDVLYMWDFGDGGAGNWPTITGMPTRSKNTAYGPLAAHVFETAGTYDVTLTVFDGVSFDTETVQITVSEWNEGVTGTTLVVAHDNDFTGAPSHAQELNSTDFDAAINNNIATRKRILFKRGGTYTSSTSAEIDVAGPGIVGAWGSGALPLVETSGGAPIAVAPSGSPTTDWRIMDLELDGNSNDVEGLNFSGEDASDILMLRLTIHHHGVGIRMSPFLNELAASEFWDACGAVECTIGPIIGGGGGNGVYIGAQRFAFLGNMLNDTTAGEHVSRWPMVYKFVISHNSFSNAADSKHAFKMQAAVFSTSPTAYTELGVISNNKFLGSDSGANVDWAVTIAPQDDVEDEQLRDIIVERNWWAPGTGQQQVAMRNGSLTRMTVRNNVVDSTGCQEADGFLFTSSGTPSRPCNDCAVYNNSFYTGTDHPLGNFNPVNFDGGTGNVARNNLGYAPNEASRDMISGGTESNNSSDAQCAVDPDFASATPSSMADFQITADSYAIGQGSTSVPVFDDYLGRSRIGVTNDMGFHQFTEGEYPWEEAGGEAPGDVIFSM